MKFNTKELTFFALLLGLSLIFGRILVFEYPPGQAAIKISIAFVSALAGIWMGPKKGFMFGALADLIGFFLLGQSSGLYYFGFTLSAALAGFVPGLIYFGFKKTRLKYIDFTIPIVITLIMLLIVVVFNVESLLGEISANGIKVNLTAVQVRLFVIIQVVSIVSLIIFTIVSRVKFNNKDKLYSIDKVIIAVLPIKMIVSFVLTPLWLLKMYGVSFIIFLPLRYMLFPAQTIISIIVLYFVLQRFSKIVEEEILVNE